MKNKNKIALSIVAAQLFYSIPMAYSTSVNPSQQQTEISPSDSSSAPIYTLRYTSSSTPDAAPVPASIKPAIKPVAKPSITKINPAPTSTYQPLTSTTISTPTPEPQNINMPTTSKEHKKIGDYSTYLAEKRVRTDIQTEDWLSQYATLKLGLGVDTSLNTTSTEIDLFIPLFYEELGIDTSTWFVQPGANFNDGRYYDGRHFLHLGLGYRNKDASSFLAFNTFYDYDSNRAHHRGNVGMEYARQYFKISANYYFPLSRWKSSTDNFDRITNNPMQNERPSYGADIYFSGYIPQIPYLSLEAKYQHFWAKEKVGLSNASNPVDNPFIFSSTINFQPVPLLTVKAGYSHEKDGEKGALLGAYLTYRFGISVDKQLQQSQLPAINSLDLRLLNPVERDHSIRLEYSDLSAPSTLNL